MNIIFGVAVSTAILSDQRSCFFGWTCCKTLWSRGVSGCVGSHIKQAISLSRITHAPFIQVNKAVQQCHSQGMDYCWMTSSMKTLD